MKTLKNFFLILAIGLFPMISMAQTATLIATSDGESMEASKLNALRAALEQAYGAYVSTNTEILNDELVKEEIVSISTGNIESYQILSQTENDGLFTTTVEAKVTLQKLRAYAESKGASVTIELPSFTLERSLTEQNFISRAKAYSNLIKKYLKLYVENKQNFIEIKDMTVKISVYNGKAVAQIDFINRYTNTYYNYLANFENEVNPLLPSNSELLKYKEYGFLYPQFSWEVDNNLTEYSRSLRKAMLYPIEGRFYKLLPIDEYYLEGYNNYDFKFSFGYDKYDYEATAIYKDNSTKVFDYEYMIEKSVDQMIRDPRELWCAFESKFENKLDVGLYRQLINPLKNKVKEYKVDKDPNDPEFIKKKKAEFRPYYHKFVLIFSLEEIESIKEFKVGLSDTPAYH